MKLKANMKGKNPANLTHIGLSYGEEKKKSVNATSLILHCVYTDPPYSNAKEYALPLEFQ